MSKHKLSQRELQVLQLVTLGRFRKEVADELGISIKTVNHHMEHAYKKLGIDNVATLVVHAYRAGYIIHLGDNIWRAGDPPYWIIHDRNP